MWFTSTESFANVLSPAIARSSPTSRRGPPISLTELALPREVEPLSYLDEGATAS
jgi:predicted transcriptional regulator